jgi:hypothetical protein
MIANTFFVRHNCSPIMFHGEFRNCLEGWFVGGRKSRKDFEYGLGELERQFSVLFSLVIAGNLFYHNQQQQPAVSRWVRNNMDQNYK